MKIEVLQSIKKTEEEYKAAISQAEAERRKSIQSAELEADNLIAKATMNAEEYRKQKLAEAHAEADRRHLQIVKDGEARAAELRERGRKNLDGAVALLADRLKGALDAGA
jgi:V/A-type H+-transporting ATPase subunit G/H